jgi:hypothetical protein
MEQRQTNNLNRENKKNVSFITNGVVNLERKLEAMCFHFLPKIAFGDPNNPIGEV